MGHTIDTLRREIEMLRTKSTNGSYFISQHDINTLLTKAIIAEAITECVHEHAVPDYQEANVVNCIFQDGKIVFGILIWKKWLHKLMSFIEHNALDSQLPLEITRAEKIMENVGWDFAQNAQWEFLPRTLTKEMSGYHSSFRNEEILPFIDETRLGEGSFGEVFKMSVLPSLQTIFPVQTAEVLVVRKTLRKDLFLEREKECLQILDHLKHPNIVKLLASYSHCEKHHFLFPLLPIDLERFLQLEERFGEFKHDFTFYIALEGLSSALAKVHSLNLNERDHDVALGRIGYHHDLKPGNVLVDSKTFYLADFGLARLRPEDKGSRTKWKSGLGDYVAPECMDEKMKPKEVGRPLDIWSFGCMVSEVAAYIEGGREGVESFRKQRSGAAFRPNMTDQYFFSGKDLRPQVISWFENLKARSEGSVLHNLLETAGLMLKIDPMERLKAAKVHQHLMFLSLKALFNDVQQGLTRHLRDIRPEAQVIRFQNARLAAWGKTFHFTGSGPWDDAIEAFRDKGDFFRDTLTSLLENVEREIRDKTVPSPAVTFSIRKPFHEELQELIDQLLNSLPNGDKKKLEDSLVTDSCEYEALYDITLSGNSELGSLASTKLEILRLREDKDRDSNLLMSKGESLPLESDKLRIEEQNFSDGLSIGRYYDKQVFVERVSCTAKWNKMSDPQKKQRMLFKTKIFRLPKKPSGFRVLDCLGFVIPTSVTSHQQHDYAFVWAFPTSTPGPAIQQKVISPISLFSILKLRNKVDLPLGERFQLAYKLVSCVRDLNIVGWLHKNISSRNIVFFEERASAISDVLKNPYLVNFRDSRPSEAVGQTERTERPAANVAWKHCQHPEYHSGGSFREIYDYYSIGIVLLELGSWIPLDSYLDHNRELQSNPSEFSNKLIERYVPRLSHIVGTTYRDVTLACLRGDFGRGSNGKEGQTVLKEFHDKVVSPLSRLSNSGI
ncbi:kinase-like domain-containing protein [Trichophaea hybrida]|nr:kinase-like domain-containing protein [Trichophaea hybrida]